MGITYHSNAKTTVHIRRQIKNSSETVAQIAERFGLNKNTVLKWKHRDNPEDQSCRPNKTRTVLTEMDEWIICEVRKSTLISIDELTEILKPFLPALNRDNIYRCLKRHGLSSLKQMTAPEKQKGETKPFKTYEPGFIHVDIKHMPKLSGETGRRYLFVAVDRATRYVFFSLKDKKDADSSVEFLKELIDYFPFKIIKILTDNGKEFTDRFVRGGTKTPGNHKFDKECGKHQIEHRLTKPYTPKTNGMVERFNGRIKEILENNRFDSYKKLEESFNHYLKCYNHFNKQKVLGYKTPTDMIIFWYQKRKDIFKEKLNISSYNLSQSD